MRLENITWAAVEKYFSGRDIVMLAVGSIENHGRHAALGTDIIIPNRIMEMVEEKSDVLILPAIPYGNADWHTGTPGTISIGHDMLRDLVYRLCKSVYKWGVRKFVIVNGHGGNTPALEEVACRLDQEGAMTAILNWWTMVWDMDSAWKGGHGGAEETAGIMAVSEELVDKSEIADNELMHLSDNIQSTGFRTASYKGVTILIPRAANKVMTNGWFGTDHPKHATKEWGEDMLKAAADYIADFVGEFEKTEIR